MNATQEKLLSIEDGTAARLLRTLIRDAKPHVDTLQNEASTPDEYEDAKVHLCAKLLGVFQAIEEMSGT